MVKTAPVPGRAGEVGREHGGPHHPEAAGLRPADDDDPASATRTVEPTRAPTSRMVFAAQHDLVVGRRYPAVDDRDEGRAP